MNDECCTAGDLVIAVFDFLPMVKKEPSQWRLDAHADNPPRLIRLKQLQAMFDAFLPGTKAVGQVDYAIHLFLTGGFIDEREFRVYDPLAKRILTRTGRSGGLRANRKYFSEDGLKRAYVSLVRFRLQAGRTADFFSGHLEGGLVDHFAYLTCQKVITPMRAGLGSVDRLIGEFLDPERRTIAWGTMIKEFGYPEDDLGDIDDAWM